MIIKDITFTLKDGRQALIRSPRDEDIQGMLNYLYISAGETEFILRYPEECSKYTAEGEKNCLTGSMLLITRQCLFAWWMARWPETARLPGKAV